MNGLTARHLPEIRAELSAWLADPGEHGGSSVWSRHLPPREAALEARAAREWAAALTIAELFYVSADMTRLAMAAGAALPSYRIAPEDLPATHGLLLWEEPVTEAFESLGSIGAPIIAASWAVKGGGLEVRLWCEREDWLRFMAKGDPTDPSMPDMTPEQIKLTRTLMPQPIVCMSSSTLPFQEVPGWLTSAPHDTSGMSLADLEDYARSASRTEQAERALVVTWLLMGQTLASEEEVRAPKSALRNIRRLNPALLTSVRYVQLRHRGHVHGEKQKIPGQRGYQFRWIVRGHWRNHYYPSRRTHRPIWIDHHVKGPEGAPLLDPDKLVNVLRR
ncbi:MULTISPECIES: hypothetical protein [unclassified Streptomyces]|uniref:hypothetical protein n=1 Tax=unclassified Streptomyces TaxID=2593676 RepID=UPI0033D4F1D1